MRIPVPQVLTWQVYIRMRFAPATDVSSSPTVAAYTSPYPQELMGRRLQVLIYRMKKWKKLKKKNNKPVPSSHSALLLFFTIYSPLILHWACRPIPRHRVVLWAQNLYQCIPFECTNRADNTRFFYPPISRDSILDDKSTGPEFFTHSTSGHLKCYRRWKTRYSEDTFSVYKQGKKL